MTFDSIFFGHKYYFFIIKIKISLIKNMMILECVLDDLHAARPQHVKEARRIPDRRHSMNRRVGKSLDRTGQRPVEPADLTGQQLKRLGWAG